VTVPSCPGFSPSGEGGVTEKGKEISIPWAYSRLPSPRPVSSSPRHQPEFGVRVGGGSNQAGRGGGRRGVTSRLVSSGVWSRGPGLSAPAKRGEPELCGECKERGELLARRRRRRPQPQPNEKRADNLCSNPGSGARRWLVAGAGGGVVSSSLPLPPAAPSPALWAPGRAHTRFLTISEHTLAARPPAAPQLLSPARRAARRGLPGAKLPLRRAAPECRPPAAVGGRGGQGGPGAPALGLGGCKRGAKRKKSKAALAPFPLL
jgi:hypothetical protein